MTIITYGDLETKTSELDNPKSWSKGLEHYIWHGRKRTSRSRIFGWFYRKLFGPDIVVLPGDLLDKSVLKQAMDETKYIVDLMKYSKSKGINSLEAQLTEVGADKNVLEEYAKGFDLDNFSLKDQSKIYADLLFREDLAFMKKSVAGAYTKIFSKIQSIAKKQKVEFAFVLGNNDLNYDLFKERYKDLGLSNVHFIDRTRKKVGKKWLAGYGSSREFPSTLGDGTGLGALVTNAYEKNVSEAVKAKKELMKYSGHVNALVVHKSVSNLDKVDWGKAVKDTLPGEDPVVPIIDELIKHFKTFRVIGGHWHDGYDFEKDGIEYITPPKRRACKTRFVPPCKLISLPRFASEA